MSVSRWKNKDILVYIHNGIVFNHKKNKTISFLAIWMELENIMVKEISET